MKTSKSKMKLYSIKGVFLIPQSKVKNTILREYYDNPLSNHQGYFKTYKQIREKF